MSILAYMNGDKLATQSMIPGNDKNLRLNGAKIHSPKSAFYYV